MIVRLATINESSVFI